MSAAMAPATYWCNRSAAAWIPAAPTTRSTSAKKFRSKRVRAMRSTLFRQEALDSFRDRHLGEVLLARPVALSLLTALSVFIALGVVSFGVFAEYTRKAKVTGYLAPTQGLIKLHAPQSGTLIDQHAMEGRRVA